MFSHVMVGANDLEASQKFYDATFKVLGHAGGVQDPKGRVFWRSDKGVFGVTKPINGEVACHANGGTIGFAAGSIDMVKAWHETGLSAGGTAIEDPPGIREGAGLQLFIAYLRDPAGNKICAVYRMPK